MKTHTQKPNTKTLLRFLLIVAGVSSIRAQDNVIPPSATEFAQSAMQKWMTDTDAQWQSVFKLEVTDIYETEVGKVKRQYTSALESGVSRASGASDLDTALALRNEQKRFAESGVFPEQDDPTDAASVKQIRAAVRTQLSRLEKERAVRAKTLHAKYDGALAQAQSQLTQRQRLDDALLVKNKREEVAAAWLAVNTTATPPVATVEPPKPTTPPAGPTVPPPSTPSPAASTSNRQLEKRLAKTTWRYGFRPNDSASSVFVTIFPDQTVTWSDKPAMHVSYQTRDELSIQVRDRIWKFAADLQSFTIHESADAPASRYGMRINSP